MFLPVPQPITIAALNGVDPLAKPWSRLFLAMASAPLAAAAAFARTPANMIAAVARKAALIAGIAGGILDTGPLFVPVLVVLAVGAVKLRGQRP